MALWLMNEVDITSEYGVVLKKGAYNNLFNLPSMKEYLTENTRDEEGETVVFYNPQVQPRDLTIPVYIHAESKEDFWVKYNRFTAFLKKEPIDLSLLKHNRVYKLYYKQSTAFTNRCKTIEGQIYVECNLVFREPNPGRVLESNILAQESGDPILTQDGKEIEILSRI